jgi:uncharacterized membrane protein
MKKLTDTLKRDWFMLLLVAAGFVIGACFYPRLPAIVPIHWDAAGNVNGYGSKFTGAFLLPIINAAMYFLYILLPHIDPKSKNYEKFNGSYRIIMSLAILLLLIVQTALLLIAIGVKINITTIVMVAVSLLFIVIGNIMGRFRFNYFVGIKTPWTLANEEVWRKTHRMSGPIWVIGGIANLIITLLCSKFEVIGLLLIVTVISIIPIVYSYILFRRIGGNS